MSGWETYKGLELPCAPPATEEGRQLRNDLRQLAERAAPSLCNGRLSLSNSQAVTVTDVTDAGTIYFVPYGGNQVAIYDDTEGYWIWQTLPGTGTSALAASVPALKFMTFDLFLYESAGTLALETVDWVGSQATGTIENATAAEPIVITSTAHGLSNGDLVGIDGMVGVTEANTYVWQVEGVAANTFKLAGSNGTGTYTADSGTWYKVPRDRATALGEQDGVLVKSGDATRRYLGTCSTTSVSGKTEDSYLRRLVWNYDNRVDRVARLIYEDDHTYNAQPYRMWNNDPAARLEVVQGVVEDCYSASLASDLRTGAQASYGLDIADKAALEQLALRFVPNNNFRGGVQALGLFDNAGYHFFQAIEADKATSNDAIFRDLYFFVQLRG